jgi:anti-anti-sigma factor
MTWLARIVEDREGDVAIAAVDGEIDSSNVREIAESVHAMLTNRSAALVVDLERTTYIDSAGINMLFVLGDELRARQQQLHLVVGPSTPIARMIQLTSLDRTHPTFATVEEALAHRRV